MKSKVTIKQAIDTFPIYLYRNNKAKSTFDAYKTDLNCFYDFIKIQLKNKIRYAAEITLVEIRQYKDYLLDNKTYKRTTVDRKFNALKTFFGHLEEDYQIINIVKNDKFGNKKRGKNALRACLPKTLNKSDLENILNTIKNSTYKDKYRDYAIFQLLINLGCRRSEILELKWTDINFYDNEITIFRPKTCNADVLRLTDALKKALLDYSDTLSIMTEYVFITRQSSKLSTTTFTEIINKYIKLSGLEIKKGFKITAHTFRHTFITFCVKENFSIEKIIKFTGHSDKDTLTIYSHLNSNDVGDVTDFFNRLIAV